MEKERQIATFFAQQDDILDICISLSDFADPQHWNELDFQSLPESDDCKL